MDNTLKYQTIVIELLNEYADFWKSNSDIQNQLILDRENHHYQLLMVGWQNKKHYIHTVCFHLDIIKGKVWIQQNNTEALIADELMTRGVSSEDIVLGFIAPEIRSHTGFAVI